MRFFFFFFFTTRLASIYLALAGAGAALASDPYNITVLYTENGQQVHARVWYGDGLLYVGSTVPANITNAFNFTVPNIRADLLYIAPVPVPSASSPSSSAAPSLPDPTFLVVNNGPGAADPVFASHSAAELTDDDLIFWARYEAYLFPVLQDGSIQSRFFLDATDTEGTYILKWSESALQSTAVGSDLAGAQVSLVTIYS
ncbi:hypothetical protein BJ170DRAFT_643513 [Xylariales sp. AK1849]|nr:hypothetical protein BJ170DRAFT_643513 [Xylariales sp. AK1849]